MTKTRESRFPAVMGILGGIALGMACGELTVRYERARGRADKRLIGGQAEIVNHDANTEPYPFAPFSSEEWELYRYDPDTGEDMYAPTPPKEWYRNRGLD